MAPLAQNSRPSDYKDVTDRVFVHPANEINFKEAKNATPIYGETHRQHLEHSHSLEQFNTHERKGRRNFADFITDKPLSPRALPKLTKNNA